MIAESIGLPLNELIANSLETPHGSTDLLTLLAIHNTHDMQNHNFTNIINRPKWIMFSSRFRILASASFKPAECRIAEYTIHRNDVIVDGLRPVSDYAINWFSATNHIQLNIIDAWLSESI
jgi:hypothetical protein